jgi:Domain of unknown function (DUF4783)
MKSKGGISVAALALVLVSFHPVYTLDDITYAIRLGNAGELSRYLDNRVDITLPEKTDNYSKVQAEMIIRDFFSTNGVRNFVVRKVGYSGSTEYCVGVLQTRNGDYRTTIFTRQKGDKEVLEELRFQVNQ